MVALARERGVNAKVARAEALPFKEGWFDRAVAVLVIHVLDRPQRSPSSPGCWRTTGGS